MIKRGFRYQTGEIEEIARLLKEGKIPEVDIDLESEIDEVIKDLGEFGFTKAEQEIACDYNAVDKIEHPDFIFRMRLIDNQDNRECFIDFYEAPNDEQDGYDEIWWG